MVNDFALVVGLDDSFTQSESRGIVESFVCAVCHGDLHEIFVPNSPRVLIVCFEHGNICDCGRVTKTTVSIEIENSIKRFYGAVLALADLWPELIENGFSREHAERFAKSHVCAICGSFLVMQYKDIRDKTRGYDLVCSRRHGPIQECGYVKIENFVFDFQRQRDWERSHKKENK